MDFFLKKALSVNSRKEKKIFNGWLEPNLIGVLLAGDDDGRRKCFDKK
jgi:hypothetical protein